MIKQNKYIDSYLNGIIRSFRYFNHDVATIHINGIKRFSESDTSCQEFIELLAKYDFIICIEGEDDSLYRIEVKCASGGNSTNFVYHLDNIPQLIDLSSRTCIPLLTLIVMRITTKFICKCKTIYKALVLDLDDTLWNGTLSEIGVDIIRQNLISDEGKPFISFMHFVCSIAKELGIFVAICSRNDITVVQEAIDNLDESIFPLKYQIDYLIANNNDKSSNLTKIAEHLSILPNSIIFIDDNSIVRDEVRANVPEIFVPEWTDHQDLNLQILSGGYFDRSELSISAQNRRKNYKIIQEERKNNDLPELTVRVHEDTKHAEAQKLYAKSNQFKLTQFGHVFSAGTKSLCFELFRKNGKSLGICSTITYFDNSDECIVLNWAISCRFFEIGVEEFVLLYMLKNIRNRLILLWQPSGLNKKAECLIEKYYGSVIFDDSSSVPNDSYDFIQFLPYDVSIKHMLQEVHNNIGSYGLYFIEDENELLKNNTNLRLISNE